VNALFTPCGEGTQEKQEWIQAQEMLQKKKNSIQDAF
jgi:hypothetical protein